MKSGQISQFSVNSSLFVNEENTFKVGSKNLLLRELLMLPSAHLFIVEENGIVYVCSLKSGGSWEKVMKFETKNVRMLEGSKRGLFSVILDDNKLVVFE